MKRLMQIFAALVILTTSSANALTFDYEHQSGVRVSWPYAWSWSYDVGFIDNAIRVDVDLAFSGAISDALWSRWETGIESIWSTTDRFAVPILFNVDRVSSGWDYLVNVVEGSGRANMLTWYTQNSTGRTAAHEAGHMWSEWDEYFGGAVDPVTHLVTNGLMGDLSGGTLSYYYDPFLEWYDAKLERYGGGETAPVPEPSTFALLAAGLVAMVAVRRRAVNG